MTDETEPIAHGIQKRFRDLSIDVREERLIRYVVKQLRLGRKMDEVMADPYVSEHTSEVTRAKILQHPEIIEAVEAEIKQQFADYSSDTHAGSEGPNPKK